MRCLHSGVRGGSTCSYSGRVRELTNAPELLSAYVGTFRTPQQRYAYRKILTTFCRRRRKQVSCSFCEDAMAPEPLVISAVRKTSVGH